MDFNFQNLKVLRGKFIQKVLETKSFTRSVQIEITSSLAKLFLSFFTKTNFTKVENYLEYHDVHYLKDYKPVLKQKQIFIDKLNLPKKFSCQLVSSYPFIVFAEGYHTIDLNNTTRFNKMVEHLKNQADYKFERQDNPLVISVCLSKEEVLSFLERSINKESADEELLNDLAEFSKNLENLKETDLKPIERPTSILNVLELFKKIVPKYSDMVENINFRPRNYYVNSFTGLNFNSQVYEDLLQNLEGKEGKILFLKSKSKDPEIYSLLRSFTIVYLNIIQKASLENKIFMEPDKFSENISKVKSLYQH